MLSYLKKKINAFNAEREYNNAIPALSKKSKNLNAGQLIDLMYDSIYQKLFWIKQVRFEILALCKIVERKQPKIALEIGTATGGSLFLISKLAHPNAIIISLDLPGGDFGGGWPEYKRKFYSSFKKENQEMYLIRGNSHEESSLNNVIDILKGRKIDFLFIDGDHTYEGVRKDFDLYTPLVAEDGIIAMHDIAKHPIEWNVQVDKCWNEVKINYRYEEYIEKINQGWAGIGVLYK